MVWRWDKAGDSLDDFGGNKEVQGYKSWQGMRWKAQWKAKEMFRASAVDNFCVVSF